MDERHAVQRLAAGADSWLRYPATVNLHRLCVLANVASEERWKEGRKRGEDKWIKIFGVILDPPSLISGMSEEVRITMPPIVIS